MLKITLAILCIAVATSNFAKEVEYSLPKGEVALIEITSTVPKLNYSYFDVGTPSVMHSFTSEQLYFQTEYLAIGSPEQAKTYMLTVPDSAQSRIIPNLSRQQIDLFSHFTSLLKPSDANASDIKLLHQSLINPRGTDLTFNLEQNLAHNLAYFYRKNQQLDLLVELLNNRTINADQKIILHCWALSESLADSKPIDANTILLIANYGKALITKYTVDGEYFQDSIEDKLNKSSFQHSCGDVLANIESRGMASTHSVSDPDWSLVTAAKAALDFALFESTKHSQSITTARVLSRMWHYYNIIEGGNEKAGQLASQALKIMQAYPEFNDEIANLLIMQYSIQHRQGKYADIRSNLFEALNMLDKLSPYDKESVLFTAGHFYRKIGEFDLSRRFFLTSLEAYKIDSPNDNSLTCSLGYAKKIDAGKSMAQLSFIEQKEGNVDLALQYAECAIEVLENSQDRYILVALLEKARILKRRNLFQEAKNIVKKVLNQFPHQVANIDASILLLDIALSQNKIPESKEIAGKLGMHLRLKSFTNVNQPEQLDGDYPLRKIEAYALMIKLCAKEKKYACMEGFYNAANELMKNKQTKLINPQAWNAARYKIVEQMVNGILTSGQKNTENAARIFMLLEKHYSLQVEQDQTLFQITAKNQELVQNDRFERWMAAEHLVLNGEEAARKSLRQEADVAKALYFSNPSTPEPDNSENSKNLMRVNDIQSTIKPYQIVTRYYIGDNHSFAIDLTASILRLRALPSKQEISNSLEQFVSSSEVFNWHAFKKSSVLKELIPMDLLEEGSFTQLLITPDHILHRLPFAAINISTIEEFYTPLATMIATYRTPNAGAYFSSKQVNYNRPQKSIAIFSAQQINKNSNKETLATERGLQSSFEKLPNLPSVQKEARYISKLLSNYKILDGIGANATSDFLMSPVVRNSNILHIATHGILDPDFPDIIALMTSDAVNQPYYGFVTLSELMSQKFSNELVVISGCDTMLGKLYKGSGMRSLTRGFLAQGVGAVIGTLWSVPDKSTAKFMQLFYTNLITGSGNIANALNQTKMSFARSARYKNPKYWSGFVLTATNDIYDNIAIH